MRLRAALSLLPAGRLALLGRAARLFGPFHRLAFLASAASSGVLGALRGGPRSFDDLAARMAPAACAREALRAYLDYGVATGELGLGDRGYRLRGALSRALAEPRNDDVAALVEEIGSLHHRLVLGAPARIREGHLGAADEVDPALIARSSRILEPFVAPLVDAALPQSGSASLLDVGCGSGAILLRAAARNPSLRATGVERVPEVAAAAREAVRAAGLAGRVAVRTGDVRALQLEARFDVVTLLNALYYFPVSERTALLRALASALVPGGTLLVVTSCRGGSAGMAALDLWCSSMAGAGPLPTSGELARHLCEAGLVDVHVERAIAGEAYFAARGTRPLAPGVFLRARSGPPEGE